MEHEYEVVGHAYAAAFALGQTYVTESVSILLRLRSFAPELEATIPDSKRAIMERHSVMEPKSAVTQVACVDAISNYCKHRYEWPDEWSSAHALGSATGQQRRTIQIVRALGVEEGEMAPSLERAAHALGLNQHAPDALCDFIQQWREDWATELRHVLGLSS